MLYLYDNDDNYLGCVKEGFVEFCFDNNGNQIGTIGKNAQSMYLYNRENKLIAIYDGINTINSVGTFIDKGNRFYEILYPHYAQLKVKKKNKYSFNHWKLALNGWNNICL